MADPAVRAAVDRARFEVLVGFELTRTSCLQRHPLTV